MVSYRSGSCNCIHYLDDFLFIGRANTLDCLYLFTEFQMTCHLFRVPLAPEKSVSPTTCLDFLDVQIDTVAMEFHLPMEKIIKTRLVL